MNIIDKDNTEEKWLGYFQTKQLKYNIYSMLNFNIIIIHYTIPWLTPIG
jgi:hypothetical protein